MARRRLPPLNHLRAFEAAARHVSFTRAAAELHVTQGAISRHVRALEDHLGIELFERTPTGVILRRQGEAYCAALTRALDEMAAATAELAQDQGVTALSLQGFTTLLMRWLIPRLPGLKSVCPNLEVRLTASPSPADFRRDRLDVAILYGNGAWPYLRADLLFHDQLFPVCSAAYLERHGPIASPAELAHHHLIHHGRRRNDWPDWLALAGVPTLDGQAESTFADLSVAYECMIEGLGIVIGQAAYFERELAAGTLVAPFGRPPEGLILQRDEGFYLVSLADQADAPHISAFRAWLLAAL